MPSQPDPADEAFRRLMERVWQRDVAPLLRGKYAQHRATGAKIGGKAAAGMGLALDRLFGLKGRPFQRSLGVLGSTLGAVVPDAWDSSWQQRADAADRRTVEDQVQHEAAMLELREAAALLGLTNLNDREALRAAWHVQAKRWHPDIAPAEQREAHRIRFVACQAAYERLNAAFERGELPATAK